MTSIAIALAIIVALPSKEASAKRNEAQITLNFIDEEPSKNLTPIKDSSEAAAIEKIAPESELSWKHQTVKSGDNLSAIFQRVSLGAGDVHTLMSSTTLAKPLIDMRPGQEIQFGFNRQGELAQLKYVKTKLESYLNTQSESDTSKNIRASTLFLNQK